MLPRTKGGDDGASEAPYGVEQAEAKAPIPASLVLAHGVIGCLAFAFVFPVGGIIIRALRWRATLWLHAGWQAAGLAMAVVTLGTGVYKALDEGYLSGPSLKYHTVLGILSICGVALQPVTGWAHHLLFKRSGGRTAWSYAHVLWGIAMVTLGTINGAFGLVLEHRETKYIIVYGVLAGAVWAAWMALSVFAQLTRGKKRAAARARAADANSSRTAGGSQEQMRLPEKPDRLQ